MEGLKYRVPHIPFPISYFNYHVLGHPVLCVKKKHTHYSKERGIICYINIYISFSIAVKSMMIYVCEYIYIMYTIYITHYFHYWRTRIGVRAATKWRRRVEKDMAMRTVLLV